MDVLLELFTFVNNDRMNSCLRKKNPIFIEFTMQ